MKYMKNDFRNDIFRNQLDKLFQTNIFVNN